MALPGDLKQGTSVTILKTENVLQRYPELIGSIATIDKVPAHPSTWFTLRTPQNQIVKLQSTALKFCKTDTNSNSSTISNNTADMPTKNRPGRPRSTSIDSTSNDKRGRSNSVDVSHAHTLTLGSEVIIRATESVMQRTPHLVGQIGYIREVPVHPATWFKVTLSDGSVATFRPSALRLSSQPEEEMVENSPYRPLPSLRTMKAKTSSQGLNDGDLQPGTSVKIISGRLHGQIAKVVGTVNGWVQVDTSYGEIAKRASELAVYEEGAGSNGIGDRQSRPSRGIKPNRFYSNDDSDSKPPPVYTRLAQVGESRPNTVRVPSGTPSTPDIQYRYECIEIDLSKRDEFEIPESWKALGLPLADPSVVRRRREYVQNYVDRQQESLRLRPDLRYWLQQIRGIFVGKSTDRPEFLDFIGGFCESCLTEKWAGGKFCWNEKCSSSPSYPSRRTSSAALAGHFFNPLEKIVNTTTGDASEAHSESFDPTSTIREEPVHVSKVASATTGSVDKGVDNVHTHLSTKEFSVSSASVIDQLPVVTFSVHDDTSGPPLSSGFKRPREDSIGNTDCEGKTPERSWSSEELAFKAIASGAESFSLPPSSGIESRAQVARPMSR